MRTIPLLLFALMLLIPERAQAQTPCGDAVTVTIGDTLHGIARRCETTLSAVLAANPQIDDPNVIRVGQAIRMPGAGEDEPESPDRPEAPAGAYTVKPGDTLGGIARRHGTTVSATMAANPQIDNPNVISVGMNLSIPGKGQPPPRQEVGVVTIHPHSGPPGTAVRVQVSGFPPFAPVNVGVGRQASEYDLVQHNLRTNERGALVTRVAIPDHASEGEGWIFVVETTDRRLRARSDPFAVTSGSSPDGTIIRGTLTDEGVECRAMRSDDGQLYTLTGDVGFEAGERVEVRGKPVEISICMQGVTIRVESIRPID